MRFMECEEKKTKFKACWVEEEKMSAFFGLLFLMAGLIGLALVWPILWLIYAIFFGAFLIGGRD